MIHPDPSTSPEPHAPDEVQVGRKLRELRMQRGLSLRALAERSGLNINTLSLIEKSKSSPSVSTLQQLAMALEIPITRFFETDQAALRVVFTPGSGRPQAAVGRTLVENLGKDLIGNVIQPFVVQLPPGAGSGGQLIVHTGHEFVYCLAGTVQYQVENQEYLLRPGDSLVFEAHLPHRWDNPTPGPAQILLVFYPSDEREEPGGRHFSLAYQKRELTLKIAVITDDGKTISQHFGRAAYYQVLTIEEGQIVQRELRSKLGHNHFSSQAHSPETHAAPHGMDPASHQRHAGMAEAISDCKVLLCGGMGRGAYESMRRLNIQPVVTNLQDIDAAAQAFIDGKLVDHTELLH